jgi:integrase
VWPSGKKVYVVHYRAGGRLRRYKIGVHGPVTAENARTEALKILSKVKDGEDPARQRGEDRKALTMKQFGESFLEKYVALHLKQTTRAEYRRSVELFINPKFGSRRVADITRGDIADFHHELRKTPYQANRTLGVLSKMFSVADLWGVRKDGCRLSEIQTLKWEHVFMDEGELRLPDSKTGAKVVQLGTAAVEILRSIPRIDENPYVIIGKKPKAHLTDLQRPWRRLRKAAGLADVRIHDLRHSFASDALELGEDLPMIGKMLGHTDTKTTARYAHLKKRSVKTATDKVAESIAAALALDSSSVDEDRKGARQRSPLESA